MTGTISRADLIDAAVLFAASQKGKRLVFHASDFTEFVNIGAINMHEETANEVLLEAVEAGKLREIGPGVYAALDSGASQ